jgi:nicotinate-nucleotide pyrophosphorylase (carboxylating)
LRPAPPGIDAIRSAVDRALAEDLGSAGDVTTAAVVPAGTLASARIVAREEIVVAGVDVAREVFLRLDASLTTKARASDGDRAAAGAVVLEISGAASPILEGERTALNFLMRMCGIATATRAAVLEIEGTGAVLLDTRKTAPGLRRLDKYAVAAGGATNHRMGLFDAILIKDTHLAVAGSIRDAVARARAGRGPAREVTVEVGTVDELNEAIAAKADRALLDNMSPEVLRRCVSVGKGRIALEASGGLAPGRLRAVAETGVDFLSAGFLTHSVRAADLAMEMEIAS